MSVVFHLDNSGVSVITPFQRCNYRICNVCFRETRYKRVGQAFCSQKHMDLTTPYRPLLTEYTLLEPKGDSRKNWPWTPEIDEELISMWNKGWSVDIISDELSRSVGSIQQRVSVLRKGGRTGIKYRQKGR